MPDFNYSYQFPDFQSFTGTTVPNILSLLQGYKTSQLGQQIAGQKELAGMGYRSAAELQGQTEANKMRQFDLEQALRQKMFNEQVRQADIARREALAQEARQRRYQMQDASLNYLRTMNPVGGSAAAMASRGNTNPYDITALFLARNPEFLRLKKSGAGVFGPSLYD